MFFVFLGFAMCEIFKFTKPSQRLNITLELNEDNINSGFFKVEQGSKMKFDVRIYSKDEGEVRPLYSNNTLKENVETHFSFNNSKRLKVEVEIVGTAYDTTESVFDSEIELYFKSNIDSFKSDVSKKFHYEPAIYALDHLLKKLNDIISSTKAVYNQSGNLGKEQKKLASFVAGFSIFTVIAYGAFSFFQLYLMKSYLNEKKYL